MFIGKSAHPSAPGIIQGRQREGAVGARQAADRERICQGRGEGSPAGPGGAGSQLRPEEPGGGREERAEQAAG